jgi:REP element-mobilizing transposase RayT
MARPLRIDVEDGWYHVTSRGTERRALFLSDRHNEHFMDLVGEMAERYEVGVHAFVLMGNHYHILIQTPHANASRAVQWLNTSFAAWFNTREDRAGHVFQGRFKSVLIDGDGAWLLDASVYLHLNPVRLSSLGLNKTDNRGEARGFREPTKEQIQERLKRLRAYLWSSYPAYGGYRRGPEWLQTEEILRRAGGPAEYREYVQRHVTRGEEPAEYDSLRESVALGTASFLEKARRLAGSAVAEKSGKAFLKPMLPFREVVKAVEGAKGEDWASFVNRYGDWGRDLAFYLARKRCRLTLAEIGEAGDGVDPRAVGQAVSRFGKRILKDKGLAQITRGCLEQLSNVKM